MLTSGRTACCARADCQFGLRVLVKLSRVKWTAHLKTYQDRLIVHISATEAMSTDSWALAVDEQESTPKSVSENVILIVLNGLAH